MRGQQIKVDKWIFVVQGGASQAKLKDRETPQHNNAYNCGIYVMNIGQFLCNAFERQQRALTFEDIVGPLRTQITPASVEEMRASTVKLILELAKQSSFQN
ncbi:hypothetical protein M758_UG073200 [Ceratodon purpureus]|nr:hypothetical protein M758_UG073200 [Ceratodon purpureus]